ncbi:MAG: DUF4365 domain-containing protein [Sandaracinaceae bacterium]|nr:DUF4365 domain-containing protein [Sandaracinaceae bacterium]
MTSTDRLGPLPTADEKAALQRRSLAALRTGLPSDRFVVRDEAEDYGVDVSIEVLCAGSATNCRAQVQLKARSGLSPNADGSFSVPIEVSNLNYLLNGPCPVYILYRPESDELFFAFALDEQRRHHAQDSSWMTAGTVTIRFATRLDAGSFGSFAERIIGEAQRHRQLRDAVAAATPGRPHRLELADDVGVLTAEEARRVLLQHGLSIVSWGFSSRVLDVLGLLPQSDVRASATLLLVRGHAEFSNGHYLSAQASLREAAAKSRDLGADDAHFLTYLLYTVEFALGELTPAAFRERCDAWRESASAHLALQYDLARLWSLRTEIGPTGVEDLHAKLEQVVRRLAAMSDAPPGLRHQARLFEMFFEAQARMTALVQALAYANEPAVWRHAYDSAPAAVVAAELENVTSWRRALRDLLSEIRDTGNAPLYCQAVHARDIAETFTLSQFRLAALHAGVAPPPVTDDIFEQLHRTQELARRFDQPELELRSRLLESDVADLAGDRERAVALAVEVRETAVTLRCAEVARAADRAIARSLNQEVRRDIARLHEEGVGVFLAEMSDEDLDHMVRDTMVSLRVPAERLPVVRDEAECQRQLARVQRDWCRHLELLQDGTLTANRASLWAAQAEWLGECTLLGRRSAIPSRDWASVLGAFRSISCADCSRRSPRLGAAR